MSQIKLLGKVQVSIFKMIIRLLLKIHNTFENYKSLQKILGKNIVNNTKFLLISLQ